MEIMVAPTAIDATIPRAIGRSAASSSVGRASLWLGHRITNSFLVGCEAGA